MDNFQNEKEKEKLFTREGVRHIPYVVSLT